MLFPVLAVDLDAFHGINSFNVYVGPLSVLMSMCSSIMITLVLSALMNDSIVIRDLIHAPIAGGIAGGTASFFTTNLAECLIVGFFAGAIQTIYQNKVEKSNAREGSILSTTSWFMFGGQALIGGIFCTIFHNIAKSHPQNFVYSTGSLVKNPIH